jgi:hypothetical protein
MENEETTYRHILFFIARTIAELQKKKQLRKTF